jgi:uncharacterized membrane protein YbhN (UPF0104 family)
MSEEKAKNVTSMPSFADGGGADDLLGLGAEPGVGGPETTHRAVRWFSWIFGFAMFVAVIIAALHFSEEREFLRIAERAQPWWLAVAVVLQAGTYLAQGETWRLVTRAAGSTLPLSVAFKLSLAKLFIDQALPSAGISGTVVVARVLEQRGVPRAVIMALVVVDSVSYYGAYVLTLTLALLMTALGGNVNRLILAVALFLVVFSVALTTAALILSGRRSAAPNWLRRIPLLGPVISLLGEADPALARSLPLIIKSVLYHLATVLLDTATVWVLIRSVGEVASPAGVFTSFIASTLLRTISIVPGGLGVFDAASVVTLQRTGVSLAASLAATLLFRGLSFWLPMVPGLYFARRVKKTE